MKRSYINCVLIAALFSIFSTASGQESTPKLIFRTSLSGAQEVTNPAGGVTTETTGGNARVEFDKKLSKATVKVVVRNGVGIVAAHFHCAPAGVNGPIVATLFTDAAGQDVNGELNLGNQAILENVDITPPAGPENEQACGVPLNNIASLAYAMLADLVYVNVHSKLNPDGVTRGQLENVPAVTPAP